MHLLVCTWLCLFLALFLCSLFVLLQTAPFSQAIIGVRAHALSACNYKRDIKVKFNNITVLNTYGDE